MSGESGMWGWGCQRPWGAATAPWGPQGLSGPTLHPPPTPAKLCSLLWKTLESGFLVAPGGVDGPGHGEVGFSAPTHCGLSQAPAKQLVGFPLSHYLEVFPTLSSVCTRDNLYVCLPVCRSPVKVPFTG